MTSPTPKVLTEADLAGLPRAVSEQRRVSLFTVYADAELRDSDNNVLAIFPAHRMDEARRVVACWNALEGVPTKEIEGVLIHGKALKDVVSERDALAGRVAELEAALQGFYRNSNRHDWPADVYDAATAALPDPLEKLTRVQKDLGLYDALSATTPESKP